MCFIYFCSLFFIVACLFMWLPVFCIRMSILVFVNLYLSLCVCMFVCLCVCV